MPAVVSTRGDERLCCPRCASELTTEPYETADFQPDWTVDDWELQQDLKVLGAITADLEARPCSTPPNTRFDEPHTSLSRRSRRHFQRRHTSALGLASWSLIFVGALAFLSGATMAAWTWTTHTPWLLTTGAWLAIGGQLPLTIGLLLRLEGLSRQRRNDERVLAELQRRLQEQSAAPAGPAPHQLLTGIRTRIDHMSEPS